MGKLPPGSIPFSSPADRPPEAMALAMKSLPSFRLMVVNSPPMSFPIARVDLIRPGLAGWLLLATALPTLAQAAATAVSGSGTAWSTAGAGGDTGLQAGPTQLAFSAGDPVNNPAAAAYIEAAGTADYGSVNARFNAGANTGSSNIGITGEGGIKAGFVDTLVFSDPTLAFDAPLSLDISIFLHAAVTPTGPFGDQFGYHYDDLFQFGILINHSYQTLATEEELNVFGTQVHVDTDAATLTVLNGEGYDIYGQLSVSTQVGGFLNHADNSPAEGRLDNVADGPGPLAGGVVDFAVGAGVTITSASGHDYNHPVADARVPDPAPGGPMLLLGLGSLGLFRRRARF